MFLSLLYCHTSSGAWAVVLKTVFTESYGKQAHSRILKSESLEGKVLALVFYKISTPDSMV